MPFSAELVRGDSMPEKFNELLLKPDIIELYNEGFTPNYGYLLNGRLEKDMVKTLYPLQTLSGNPITWEANKTEYLFPNVSLQPKQAGTGDPSPENVRPISGYDSVAVNLKGKNLISDENFQSSEKNGITFTKKGNGVVHVEGTATAQADSTVVSNLIQLPPGLYFGVNELLLNFVVKKANTGKNKYYSAAGGVTIEEGDVLQYFYIAIPNGGTVNKDIYIFLAAGESPFQVSDFEPYQPGTTVTLTLPEIIYGGTVDAVTGEGKGEWSAPISLTGEESWDEPSVVTSGYKNYRIIKFFPYVVDEIVSSHFLGQANTMYYIPPHSNRATSFSNTVQLIVQVSESVAPDIDSWKSYLAAQASVGTPVQVAYKLATPESFQATGNQALTIQPGNHTIYTDGDNISLTRKARRLEV